MPRFDLSYVSAEDPLWKRALMRTVENIAGRRKLLPLYRYWSDTFAGSSPFMWTKAFELIETDLNIVAEEGWQNRLPDGPLLIIGNHPFGIADGIAAMSIAEKIGRPYRVILNQDLMRIPEVAPYGLPIDFSETKEAIKANLKTRSDAHQLLKDGTVIIIFPSGGVATAASPWGRAEELPWKQFVVRLAQRSEATILPLYFEGQNSWLFHLASQFSLPTRLALLVAEFRHHLHSSMNVYLGEPTRWQELANSQRGTTEQLEALFLLVHSLSSETQSAEELRHRFRSSQQLQFYPWERWY